MNREKWIVALIATQQRGPRTINGFGAVCIEAASELEAEGLGMRICLKRLPAWDGWQNHAVGVDPFIVKTLDDISPAEPPQ